MSEADQDPGIAAVDPATGRPRYARPERERRWLVPDAMAVTLAREPATLIRDLYLVSTKLEPTRLRLRRMEEPGG